MNLKIIIFYCLLQSIVSQIINHHIPRNHEGSSTKLNWPSLNIIMHVPTSNGTLKRVPIYQDPGSIRRQQIRQRKLDGHYYTASESKNISTTSNETPWSLGRPPGVHYDGFPGVNGQTFHPGYTGPPSRRPNMSSPHLKFTAQRDPNSKLPLNVSIAMSPEPTKYILERISNENQSSVEYSGGGDNKQMYTNQFDPQQNVPPSNYEFVQEEPERRMYSGQYNYQEQEGPIETYTTSAAGLADMLATIMNDSRQQYLPPQQSRRFPPMYDQRYYQPQPQPQYFPRNIQYPTDFERQIYRPGEMQFYRKEIKNFTENESKSFNNQDNVQRYNYTIGGDNKNVPFFWDGNSPMNISITQKDPQNKTLFAYTFDPTELIKRNNMSNPFKNFSQGLNNAQIIIHKRPIEPINQSYATPSKFNFRQRNFQYPPRRSYENTRSNEYLQNRSPEHSTTQKREQKIQKTDNSEFLENYRKEKLKSSENTFEKYYSALQETVNSKLNEDFTITGVKQDSDGNYMYQHLDSNDRKPAIGINTNNMILVSTAPPRIQNNTTTKGHFILMELKKPGKQRPTTDFKSKVEPLIITSIYRQFLSDLKKNLTNNKKQKSKLHFSFKLGPGYLNKNLMEPKNHTKHEDFKSDDESYDSRNIFHD